MSAIEENFTRKIELKNVFNVDLTNCCRICKLEANKENGIKLRPLFDGRRLTRIIANTVHIEIKDTPGLPRFLCDKCLNTMITFSTFQLDFRRSEEDFNMVLEARENHKMNVLHAFAAAVQIEKRHENDQNAAAVVKNLFKDTKKTKKSKSKRQK